MAKKRVYVESTVISYLTARPSRDFFMLAKQRLTCDWWALREKWDLYVSSAVLLEIADGDSTAAGKRLEMAEKLSLLADHPKVEMLAEKLFVDVPIPGKAKADAAHLAFSAFYKMDYLATWNQAHLDNPHSREKIDSIIKGQGMNPAFVLTPERLLEMEND